MANTVLKLNNFTVVYKTQKGPLEAVRNVSFELKEGETLAIVGESGCGKSSLARGILRLFPRNLEKATGEIYINGTEVLSLKEEEFRKNIRWSKISMVFQGAMNSLNPIPKNSTSSSRAINCSLWNGKILLLIKELKKY